MMMVIRVSTLKFKNFDKMRVWDSGQEELELRLQARERGREPRIEKAETAAITKPYPWVHEEF